LSSLPPPAHVTNLTSLVPQSLSKAAAAMKPKTAARLTKPAIESTRTVLPDKMTVSAGLTGSRLLTSYTAAVNNSVIYDSDDEGGATADFFSLDATDKPAAVLPASFKCSEAMDVRWHESTSLVEPTATFVPPGNDNVSAASADIVWNATTYTSSVMGLPPACDAATVCRYLF